jgi:hypothetical protein
MQKCIMKCINEGCFLPISTCYHLLQVVENRCKPCILKGVGSLERVTS